MYHKRLLFRAFLVPDEFYAEMDVCYLAFTVTIYVSMAVVVRTTEGFCPGNLAISGMIFFQLSFYFSGTATVIFSLIAIVCVELRERFLLVVGTSFLLVLLWLM